MVHIADAPCHGKEFYESNDDPENFDFFPNGVTQKEVREELERLGELDQIPEDYFIVREDKPWKDLLGWFKEKQIFYYFVSPYSITDIMVDKFISLYGLANAPGPTFAEKISTKSSQDTSQALLSLLSKSFESSLENSKKQFKNISLNKKVLDENKALINIKEHKEKEKVVETKIVLNTIVIPNRYYDLNSVKKTQKTECLCLFYANLDHIDEIEGSPLLVRRKAHLYVDADPFSEGTFNLAYYGYLKIFLPENDCGETKELDFKVVVKKPKKMKPD